MKIIKSKQLVNRLPKFVIPLAATLLYILLYISFQDMVGSILAAISILPVILAGWYLGIKAAFFWSLFILIINTILYSNFIGVENTRTYLIETSPGFIAILASGIIAGWIRSLDQKNKLEIEERKKIELALQISENKFRTQFENMVEGMAINQIIYEDGKPIDWIITDINPAYERIMRLSREDVIGKLATTIYGSYAAIEPFLKVYDTVLITGISISNQQNYLIRERKITFSASSLGDNQVAVIFTDVTEQEKIIQSEMKHREYMLTMGKIATALNETMDLDEVLNIILENLEQFVQFDAADITLIVDNRLKIARHIGYDNLNLVDFADNFNPHINDIYTCKWMIENQKPLIVADTSASEIWTTLPEVEWINSYLGLPIIAKGKIVGLLNFLSAKKGFYEDFPFEQLYPFSEQAAMAIENSRTFEETQERSKRLAIINKIAFRMNQPAELEEIQQLAVDSLAEALNINQVGLAMMNPDKKTMTIAADHPGPGNSSVKGSSIPLENNPSMDYILEHKSSFHSIDAQNDPLLTAVNHFMTSQHINSILIIPLIVSGEVIGTIGCDIINDNRILTSEEINLAEILTNLVAGRIELEKLITNEKKRATELAMLHETSLAITKPYELSKLHNQIIERATWLLGASAGMLYLRNDQIDVFECKVSFNNQYDLVGTTMRLGEGAVGIVAQTSQPLIIEDYVNWDKKPTSFNNIQGNFSLLSVPVIHQSQTLGVIQIIREHGKPSFENSDADLLSLFSSQVAITLENSRLLTEVQKLAVLDPLTGLLNRRGFAKLAEREIDRAHRFKHSLSLLFLDLDHFKEINDEHGHLIGDQILVGIADRCKNILRSVDLTCRYGGEEFVILLVETNLEDAVEVGKRINNVIKLYPFITDIGPINITISIGVARFEKHMHNIDAIIQNADTALYKAKSAGRDRVVPFLENDSPQDIKTQ